MLKTNKQTNCIIWLAIKWNVIICEWVKCICDSKNVNVVFVIWKKKNSINKYCQIDNKHEQDLRRAEWVLLFRFQDQNKMPLKVAPCFISPVLTEQICTNTDEHIENYYPSSSWGIFCNTSFEGGSCCNPSLDFLYRKPDNPIFATSV